MKRCLLLSILVALVAGCRAVRMAEVPTGPNFRILTYNVNWGGPSPELAAEIIRQSGAEIVCLQETTPHWEAFLRKALKSEYSFAQFRNSENRMGGGLAFLSKVPAREIAYIPSNTGWFDGWIMSFETAAGPVQVLNVHLRPPVSDKGSWISGYLTTSDERLREMERFYSQRRPGLPTLVAGDFNDREHSPVIQWLKEKGMINALPEFDRSTPTWHWRAGVFSLSRRMDHVVYAPELRCFSARVYSGWRFRSFSGGGCVCQIKNGRTKIWHFVKQLAESTIVAIKGPADFFKSEPLNHLDQVRDFVRRVTDPVEDRTRLRRLQEKDLQQFVEQKVCL